MLRLSVSLWVSMHVSAVLGVQKVLDPHNLSYRWLWAPQCGYKKSNLGPLAATKNSYLLSYLSSLEKFLGNWKKIKYSIMQIMQPNMK